MGRAQVAYVVCGVDLSGLGLDGGGGGFGFGFGCSKHVLLNIGEVEREGKDRVRQGASSRADFTRAGPAPSPQSCMARAN